MGVGSSLWIPEIESRSSDFVAKCLHLLSHLSGQQFCFVVYFLRESYYVVQAGLDLCSSD